MLGQDINMLAILILLSQQVSDVIDMKEDTLNPTVLTMVLSEERGHVYQFQTSHDMAVFR